MNRWLKWTLVVLLVGLLVAGALRTLSSRQQQQEKTATQANERAQTVVDLGSKDVLEAKIRQMTLNLSISGTLKAVNSAMVKARVAGELQDLSVREGDTVKAGQIIARVDASEYQARVRQAQQQAESAKAQVDIARRAFDNNRSLVDQGFISKTALDTSQASLAAAEASYRAALAGTDVATKSLDDTVLRAPISGLISQRLAQAGERVAIEARIVEIVDLSRLELEASLSAAESLDLRLGQSALLQVEGSVKPIAARVVRINPSAMAGSRSVVAYLAIDAAPGLRQGLFAQGTLATGQMQAVTVQLSAVRTDKPQPYVQLLTGHKVLHQTVEIGSRGEVDGQIMVAIKGVSENARLVSGSVGTLRDGTAVRITSPALPAASAK